jgi:hypothetical protein
VKLTGVVSTDEGAGRAARVVFVGEGRAVLGETDADADGRWSFETAAEVVSVVAQLAGQRQFAAVAVAPQTATSIVLPRLLPLAIDFDPAPEGVVLWLDPVELEGFPQDLLWALRTHPHNVFDLHLREFPVDSPGLSLEVQRGRYSLSGGRVEVSPAFFVPNFALQQVTDEATGVVSASADGVATVEVLQPARYRVRFSPITN